MYTLAQRFSFTNPINSFAVFSYAMFALGLFLLALMAFDHQQILGINRWIKPTKFAFSLGLYGLTICYFLSILSAAHANLAHRYGQIFTLLMLIEISLIILQAARGTTSHFNYSTLFNAIVFQTMGVAIFINTALVGYMTWLFFRNDYELSPAMIWAIRLGLIIFLLASVEGGFMASYNSHSVGNADGAVGLPILNWNRIGGDLRIAHFVGMHAIQGLPILAFFVHRWQSKTASVVTIFLAAGLWLALTAATFIQAILGRPLL